MKKNLFRLAAFAMVASSVMTISCTDEGDGGKIEKPSTELKGELTEDLTLKAGDYTISGKYAVKAGATLTIEPGVKIVAVDDQTVDYILVEKGAKINAQGSATNPIVMTAELKEHGAWGGIHICGDAKVNIGSGISEIGDAEYGGENDNDNSGTLKYVRVEYAGYCFTEDKEANGFTFYGVGNGTTLENLEAYKGSDDGYEWFGGCVNAKNLISVDNQDDSFDWTYGWTGTVENAVAYQIGDYCDHMCEGDSNKTDATALPISHPTFKNATMIGVDKSGSIRGIKVRRGSEITLDNVVIAGKSNSLFVDAKDSQTTYDRFMANSANIKGVQMTSSVVEVNEGNDGIFIDGIEGNKSFSFVDGYKLAAGVGAGDVAWAAGWSKFNSEDDDVPAVAADVLKGDLTADKTLAKGEYKISGKYTVKAGATLTIEAGVKITAVDDATVDYILVEKGAKINAVGTATEPIVMTAELEEHGAWGGIHICGDAEVNIGTGVSEIGDAAYGGKNNADNSGVLKYVRVEYAGYCFTEDKEANGFTFYGVGNGTTLENLEAYKGADDGYEWFGGCVNAKNLVSVDNQDDSFDWTYGWTGTVENAIAYQIGEYCDHMCEGDSHKTNVDAKPISHPTFKNATMIGVNKNGSIRGIKVRRGSAIDLDNVVIAGKTNSIFVDSSDISDTANCFNSASVKNVKVTAAALETTADFPVSNIAGITFNYAPSFTNKFMLAEGVGAGKADWTAGWTKF